MHVESLFVYPVKSLSGIALSSSKVNPRGLEHDRRFMLTTSDFQFITQRTHPMLTAFSVAMNGDTICVSHPAGGSIEFATAPPEGASEKAVVWDDTVAVSLVSRQADEFFSEVLGERIHLVGMPESTYRQVDPEFGSIGDSVSFADGYPILLLGSASIEELNSRLDKPVPMNRFRPNIVISGAGAWEEDDWTSIRLGEVGLDLVKPCARCIVIRTDQETGERHIEPIATLKTYRRFDNKIMVGMNAIPAVFGSNAGIFVGQQVKVSG